MMKRITLIRPEERFNKNCAYEIFIGGQKVAVLKSGERKTVELPDILEQSEMKAKIEMQWVGSMPVDIADVKDGGNIYISGNEFLNRRMPLMGAMLPLTGIIVTISGNPSLKFGGTGILVMILIGLIGTLTVWRNKWLSVRTTAA